MDERRGGSRERSTVRDLKRAGRRRGAFLFGRRRSRPSTFLLRCGGPGVRAASAGHPDDVAKSCAGSPLRFLVVPGHKIPERRARRRDTRAVHGGGEVRRERRVAREPRTRGARDGEDSPAGAGRRSGRRADPLALLAPAYQGESASSTGSRTPTATLVGINGVWIVWLLCVPLALAGIAWLALRAARARRGSRTARSARSRSSVLPRSASGSYRRRWHSSLADIDRRPGPKPPHHEPSAAAVARMQPCDSARPGVPPIP